MAIAPQHEMSGTRRIELIALLGGLTTFAPISTDMYLPAMPTIAREFAVPIGAIEHTLATFFLGFSLGQALFGPLADRFGRKLPLYGGLAAYVAASIACAMVNDAGLLAVLRFVQALGACAGIVIARASVRDLFGGHEAARVFSYMMLVLGLAPLLAPLLGGYVLAWLGWRAIFLLQGSAGLAAVAACFFRLPESHGGTRRTLNPRRVLWDYLMLSLDRRFIGYVLAGAVSHAGLFAYITGSAHVFIDLFHVRAENFGLFFGTNALGLITVSQVTARLLRHHKAERILLLSQSVQCLAGLALLAAAVTGFGGLWGIAVGLFVFVSLNAAILPTASGLALRHFGLQAGMASALLGTIQFGLGAMVATMVGAFSPATPVPMALVIAGCGISGLVFSFVLAPREGAGEAAPQTQ